MKCKVYMSKSGAEVKSFEGSSQEFKEYFQDAVSAGTKTHPVSKVQVETVEVSIPAGAKVPDFVSPTMAVVKSVPKKYRLQNKKYWTKSEDDALTNEVKQYGGGSQAVFKTIEKKFPNRTWKSCENRYYKLVNGLVKPHSFVTAKRTGTIVKSKKSNTNKYTQWTPADDKFLDAFIVDPLNYFVNGHVKQVKIDAFAKKIGRTKSAVKARLHYRKIGSLESIRKMIAKAKRAKRKVRKSKKLLREQGVSGITPKRPYNMVNRGKQTEAKVLKQLHEVVKQKKVVEFPTLNYAKVEKVSYLNTFKYFTAVKGNTISVKDAFPLFGISTPEEWDKLLHEIISKGPSICASLNIANSSFKMVSGEYGRILQFGALDGY